MKRSFRQLSFMGSLVCFFTLMSTLTQAQVYNNRYTEASSLIALNCKGKSVVDDGCRTVVLNSMQNNMLNYDFHLSVLDQTGVLMSSFYYGDPSANEYANALCISHNVGSGYIAVGKSSNNEFLIMKIDGSGNLFWTTEVSFGSGTAEAIEILPVIGTNRYVVVGNNGNEIAACGIDDNGNYLWSYEYPFSSSYAYNRVTDINYVGDQSNPLGAHIAVSGEHHTGTMEDVFVFHMYDYNGEPLYGSIYEHSLGYALRQPQVVQHPNSTNEIAVTLSQNQNVWGGPMREIVLFNTDVANYSIINQDAYNYPPMYDLWNEDLIYNNGNFIALGTEHINPSEYNEYLLYLDPSGAFITEHSINEGNTEFASSITESCVPDEILIDGAVRIGPTQEMRVIRNDGSLINCMTDHVWNQLPSYLYEIPVDVTADIIGGPNGYNYPATPTDMTDYFDCYGNPLLPITDETGDITESYFAGLNEETAENEWIYPNPSTGIVNIQLGDEVEALYIFNVNGEVVYTNTSSNLIILDASEWSNGIYIVQRSLKNGEVERDKLILK